MSGFILEGMMMMMMMMIIIIIITTITLSQDVGHLTFQEFHLFLFFSQFFLVLVSCPFPSTACRDSGSVTVILARKTTFEQKRR